MFEALNVSIIEAQAKFFVPFKQVRISTQGENLTYCEQIKVVKEEEQMMHFLKIVQDKIFALCIANRNCECSIFKISFRNCQESESQNH